MKKQDLGLLNLKKRKKIEYVEQDDKEEGINNIYKLY